MLHLNTRKRGATPRKLRPILRAATKAGLHEGAEFFHEELRDRRFTKAHAAAAGYLKRKPAYEKRKRRQMGHDRPLEWSGKTRERIKTQFRISATSKRGTVRYAGARTFNRNNPKSPIKMYEEFGILLPEEAEQMAEILDRRLDAELAAAGR